MKDKDEMSSTEIARIRHAEEEIARGEFVTWEPGMFSKSSSPKVAARKSTDTRVKSAKRLTNQSKKSPKTLIAENA